MAQPGRFHTLPIVRMTDYGAFLDLGDQTQVLLPKRYVQDSLAVGDFVRVFLHFDSEDRLIATTDTPKATLGQFAFLRVTATGRFGAFLDWGLGKDLLVPFAEQHKPMEEGRSYLVHIYQNAQDGRLMASSKVDRFLDKTPPRYKVGQAVSLIIANSTDLGYKAIVEHQHWGLIFESEAGGRLRFGDSVQGFVKRVRPDGKIDLGLARPAERHDQNVDRVWAALERAGGLLPLNDKSSPADIEKQLGISKAAFKRAVGTLLKQGKVAQDTGGLRRL
ncbi:CvfB family protein [Simiduia agarivorans]|uniref:S1 motif domain-containing protein n=1 Tax=Simiduia agarivorans (strain DSM 21679 / JCM 13881 / BCRC 17597 / SA1) TaxID=1117647 RepID=K4KQZ6_SIMAS|nr:S1-like domain-containing RNA-binding protein [Simiduia agarivorans]AFV00661.1 hypothetical protein M5M_17660 [Simiduia agarivorans SA1 = DSM 21679]